MAERDAEAEAARRGLTVAQVWTERAAAYPIGRVLQPEEIARVIAFLASADAGGINGEALTVAFGGLW
jgi:NAD(P)-dependent dehydrogenase (short-subunit alcohol dehydrogenase family)